MVPIPTKGREDVLARFELHPSRGRELLWLSGFSSTPPVGEGRGEGEIDTLPRC